MENTKPLKESLDWKRRDRDYHQELHVVDSYDRRITKKYRLEHKHYTVDKWIKEIKKHPESLVLDFGCGTGAVTLALLKNNIKTISLDDSLVMLNELKIKAVEGGVKCVCVAGDAENLPFKESIFDALICAGVLHHLPDIGKAVEGQVRVLNENGLLFIAEPFKNAPWFSWPYHFLVNFIKFIVCLFKKNKVETFERPLERLHLSLISDIFDKYNLNFSIEYLVYWPIITAYFPKFIAVPFIYFLNKINKGSLSGESVIIKARKK